MNDDVDDECNVAAQLDLDFFSQRLEFTAVIAKPQRQHEEELCLQWTGSDNAAKLCSDVGFADVAGVMLHCILTYTVMYHK